MDSMDSTQSQYLGLVKNEFKIIYIVHIN